MTFPHSNFSPTFPDIINLCGEKEGTLPISTIPFWLLTKFQHQEWYFFKVNKQVWCNRFGKYFVIMKSSPRPCYENTSKIQRHSRLIFMNISSNKIYSKMSPQPTWRISWPGLFIIPVNSDPNRGVSGDNNVILNTRYSE